MAATMGLSRRTAVLFSSSTASPGISRALGAAAWVAALIIGRNGGSMDPAQVEAALLASSDDLGNPAKTPFMVMDAVMSLKAIQYDDKRGGR
jgi:lantibiotic leader peptide-processing serine protease